MTRERSSLSVAAANLLAPVRAWLTTTLLLFATGSVVLCPQAVHAQSESRSFDIAAQPLGTALKALAKQAGLQILYSAALVEGRTSPELKGTMTTGEALDSLLRDSGLQATMNGRTITLERSERASEADSQLPEVAVVSTQMHESPVGPDSGYVAKNSFIGTKTDAPVLETPQSISIITRDRMVEQGVQTVQDALRYSAGVRSDAYGYDTRGDWVFVRGTEPLMFTDGMRGLFGYYNNVRPDPYALERVEVLRGPPSVLYGQSTTGGMVNVVSKRPQAEAMRQIEVQIGSYDRRQVAVDLTGPLTEDGKWLYRLVALGRDSDTQVDYVTDDRMLLAPSLTWRPSAATSWTFLFNFQKDESGSSAAFLPWSGTLLPNPNGQIPTSRFISEPGFDEYHTEQMSMGWAFEHRANDAWTLRQNLRYVRSKASYQTMYPDVYSDPANPYINANQSVLNRYIDVTKPQAGSFTVDNQAEVKLALGATEHDVLLGIDFSRYWEHRTSAFDVSTPIDVYSPVYGNYTYPALTDNPGNSEWQVGVYVQDRIKFDQRWIGLVGLRRDKTGSEVADDAQEDGATSARLGLVFLAGAGWAPYASYTESFQPEVGVDFYNQAFKPKRGAQFEVGLKYQPPGMQFEATASVYDLRETNRRVPDPANPLNEIQAGEANTKGLELEVTGTVGRNLDLIATYTYTNLQIVEDGMPDAPVAGVPRNMASVWANYRFVVGNLPGRLSAGAGVRYIGTTTDETGNLHVPSITLFDVLFGYDTGPWRFALNATNLADKTYVSSCLSRGDCFYGSRRTVMASARYDF